MSVSLMSAGGVSLDTTTAEAWDIKSGETAYNGDGELVTGTMVDQGAKKVSLAPGGSYTIPAGYHNGSGQVTAAALKTVTMNVASWPHAYPEMEWNYTMTGGTLVGIASLDGASGDGSTNIVGRIRIVGNTIYVQNQQGGIPNRNITLLYY